MVTFDPAALASRVTELEHELSQPGFWDNQEHAAKISAEHAKVLRRLERFRALQKEYEEAVELLAMDPEMADEIALVPAADAQGPRAPAEDALFNGEYDGGDRSSRSRTPPRQPTPRTFTEMMLRMYQRWAADRGFKTELVERRARGKRPVLKSATFTVEGENATDILKAERGKHRLVRQSPFDQAHRRHTSLFAQVIPAPLLLG